MFSRKWKDNNRNKTAAIQSLDNLYFIQCLTSFFFINHLGCRYIRNWLLNLNLIWKTLWTGVGNGLLISVLKKLNWFHLIGLMALVPLMWKWMDLLLRKNDLLRYWGWLSLLNWIGALILSLFLKLHPRKLMLWFVLWSFLPLRLLCISINLPDAHAWNTVIMSGLVPLIAFNMKDCRSFNCYPYWTLGSLPKCSHLKSFLLVLLW